MLLVLILVVGVDGLPALLLDAGVVLAVLLLIFLLSRAPAEAAPMAVLAPTGAAEAAAAAATTEAEDEDVPPAAAAEASSLARRARSILIRWSLRSSSSSDELIGDLVGDLLAYAGGEGGLGADADADADAEALETKSTSSSALEEVNEPEEEEFTADRSTNADGERSAVVFSGPSVIMVAVRCWLVVLLMVAAAAPAMGLCRISCDGLPVRSESSKSVEWRKPPSISSRGPRPLSPLDPPNPYRQEGDSLGNCCAST